MKRVWQPRSEIRAKTVKTRVLGSSLSSSRPSTAILVIDLLFQILCTHADDDDDDDDETFI